MDIPYGGLPVGCGSGGGTDLGVAPPMFLLKSECEDCVPASFDLAPPGGPWLCRITGRCTDPTGPDGGGGDGDGGDGDGKKCCCPSSSGPDGGPPGGNGDGPPPPLKVAHTRKDGLGRPYTLPSWSVWRPAMPGVGEGGPGGGFCDSPDCSGDGSGGGAGDGCCCADSSGTGAQGDGTGVPESPPLIGIFPERVIPRPKIFIDRAFWRGTEKRNKKRPDGGPWHEGPGHGGDGDGGAGSVCDDPLQKDPADPPDPTGTGTCHGGGVSAGDPRGRPPQIVPAPPTGTD